ncbi:MAG: 4Fe-4S dicluster domain-containing protein [Bacillota bacterium]
MAEDLIAAIRRAGVVGAGGAGFPSHVKMSARAEYVIVNGAECEPLIRVDQQLLQSEARTVWAALKKLIKATGAKRGIVALKGKYRAAVDELQRQKKPRECELFILNDFYPAGDEHVLVHEVTGRTVPEAGIPLNVGCIVTNVETLINTAAALEGRPVVDKYITVAGEVPQPVTCSVPLGTSINEVLGMAGLKDVGGRVVIEGGPMMGRVVENIARPVTKTTKGLIVLPEGHPLAVRKTRPEGRELKMSRTSCVQCYRCTEVCPRYLLGHRLQPHKVMRSLAYMLKDPGVVQSSLLCSECGACEYACIMNLSPRRMNSEIKRQLAAAGVRFTAPLPESVPLGVRDHRKIPSKRLINFLGLGLYDVSAPLLEEGIIPRRVVLPLKQHTGLASVPVVCEGQKVARGELVADIPEDSLGACLHASIDGTVTGVTADQITIQA